MARRRIVYLEPDDLSGLHGWWKADSISLNDGDAISQWDDSSGNGHHATQATGSRQPTFKKSIVNGQPVVRCDGSDSLVVANTASHDLATYTLFVVARRTSGSGGITGKGTTAFTDGRRRKLNFSYPDATNVRFTTGADGASVTKTVTSTADFTVSVVVARANNDHDIVVNNSTSNFTTVLSDSDFNTAAVTIGSGFGQASENFNGDIAEIIFFSRPLLTDEVLAIQNYLANKYNVTATGLGANLRTAIPKGDYVSDSFTRANSSLTLGTSELGGKTWLNLNSNTGGISSNSAYSVTGANNQASYVNTDIADVDVGVTVSTYGGGVAQQAVYFRITDGNNFWRFQHDNGNFYLLKKVAAANTTFGTTAIAKANGDRLRVLASGNLIKCFLNDRLIIQVTDSFNASATAHGFGNATGNSGARFDNFYLHKASGRRLATGRV